MPRQRLVLLSVIALVVLGTVLAGTASAAPLSVKAVTNQLRGQRIFIQPAVKPRPVVAELRARIRQQTYRGIRLVILAQPLRGTSNAQRSAQAIVEEFGDTPVTVVVVVKKLGAASSQQQYSEEQVAAAAAAANQSAAGPDQVALMTAFLDSLVQPAEPPATGAAEGAETGAAAGAEDDGAAADDGRPWWHYVLAVIAALAVLAGLLALLRARSRDRRKRRRGGSIGTARDFHLDRLERLARRHAELVRPIAERGEDPELRQHYDTAGGKLVALRRSIPQLGSPRELRTAATELDEIEWHIETAEAMVAGIDLPDRPLRDRPALCFFTHEHGLAKEEIDLVRPDGTITAVRVCPANARALERGEPPAVSTVHVGGREIPWPAAPTWYGAPGWTLEDLPGTEYQGREIWGRDMPRRDAPLPEAVGGSALAAGAMAAEGGEELGADELPGVPAEDAEPDAPAAADAAPAGMLDPEDLAAIERGGALPEAEEQPVEPEVREAPTVEEDALPPVEDENDETMAFDPFAGSEDLAPWERDEDAPPRGGG
jgi:hypothetical protein